MDSIISYVIGPKCYRTFFMEGDFMDVPCLKYSISKGLGYGIVVGSAIMKLPQILKIVMNRDVTGLNVMSFYMEYAVLRPSIVYNLLAVSSLVPSDVASRRVPPASRCATFSASFSPSSASRLPCSIVRRR